MNSIYLRKTDLEDILEFVNSFDKDIVEIKVDNSSGIGSVISATLHSVIVNGNSLVVTKEIVDETSW